jgi:hypothetical protein
VKPHASPKIKVANNKYYFCFSICQSVKTHVKNRVRIRKNMNDRRSDMSKLGALTILLALAAVIYFFSPGSQVQVAKKQQAIEATMPDALTNEPAKPTQAEIPAPELTNSIEPHSDHEGHDENEKIEIPQYIKDSLEAQRIPASELVKEKHSDGSSSIDFKGQYQHVPIAIIGEDGKVKITETRIEPIVGQ